MFTEKDLMVGTILVYRNQTESYKYFRILKVYDIKYAVQEFLDDMYVTWNYTFGRDGDIVSRRPQSPNIKSQWTTEFEMAKELNGEWVKAEHQCEVKYWHENCDILFHPVDEKISRLDRVE